MKQYDSVKHRIPLPKAVYDLNQLFTSFNHNLFVVGGVVRDFLYVIEFGTVFSPKDVDLATEAFLKW
jgi:tRNA nucleotidyltransferase/poly(A) polymerase